MHHKANGGLRIAGCILRTIFILLVIVFCLPAAEGTCDSAKSFGRRLWREIRFLFRRERQDPSAAARH